SLGGDLAVPLPIVLGRVALGREATLGAARKHKRRVGQSLVAAGAVVNIGGFGLAGALLVRRAWVAAAAQITAGCKAIGRRDRCIPIAIARFHLGDLLG